MYGFIMYLCGGVPIYMWKGDGSIEINPGSEFGARVRLDLEGDKVQMGSLGKEGFHALVMGLKEVFDRLFHGTGFGSRKPGAIEVIEAPVILVPPLKGCIELVDIALIQNKESMRVLLDQSLEIIDLRPNIEIFGETHVHLRKADGLRVHLRKADGLRVHLRKADGLRVHLRKADGLPRRPTG
jgi:hypothetical protein